MNLASRRKQYDFTFIPPTPLTRRRYRPIPPGYRQAPAW